MPKTVTMQAGGWLSVAAALFFLAITLLLAYEAWCLFNGHPPITAIVRAKAQEHVGAVALFCLLLGLLIGHFFWQ
jgi:hypothetical protein